MISSLFLVPTNNYSKGYSPGQGSHESHVNCDEPLTGGLY